jgi:hypothetical protein
MLIPDRRAWAPSTVDPFGSTFLAINGQRGTSFPFPFVGQQFKSSLSEGQHSVLVTRLFG